MKKESISTDQSQLNIQESPDFFPNLDHQRQYQKLITGLNEGKELLIITGASGLGKTFLLRRVIHKLGDNTQTIKILGNGQNYDEFLDAISTETGFDISNESTLAEKLDFLTRCFNSLTFDHFVIQIDHADQLKMDTLGAILYWVKSLGLSDKLNPSIHFILAGLPALTELLEKSGLHKLNNNTIVQCQLNPLNKEEILEYIEFHLHRANADIKQFEQNALQKIILYSQGNLGLINKLCDLGLLTASLADDPMVTAAIIDEVADTSLTIQNKDKSPRKHVVKRDILSNSSEKSELLDLLSPSTQPEQPTQSPLLNQLLSEQGQGVKINVNTLKKDPFVPHQNNETVESSLSHIDTPSSSPETSQLQSDNEDTLPKKRMDDISSFPKTVPIQKIKVPPSYSDKRYKKSSKNSPLLGQKSFIIGLIIGAIISIGGFLFVNKTTGESPLENQSQSELTVSKIQIIQRSQPSRLTNKIIEEPGNPAATAALPSPSEISGSIASDTEKTDAQEQARIDDLQNRIATLLLQADQQFANKQLLTPSDDSAWQTYQHILEIDPDNEQALAGIDKITRTYIVWAQEEIKKGNYLNADYLYKKALKVSPDNSDALYGLSELDKKRQKLRQSTSAAVKTEPKKSQDIGTLDIAELLQRAEQQIAKKQLLTPPEDSAWQSYQTILSQDPENKQALAGIARIAHTYVIWAKEEIKRGNPEHAKYLFNRALEVVPGNSEALAGLATLRQ